MAKLLLGEHSRWWSLNKEYKDFLLLLPSTHFFLSLLLFVPFQIISTEVKNQSRQSRDSYQIWAQWSWSFWVILWKTIWDRYASLGGHIIGYCAFYVGHESVKSSYVGFAILQSICVSEPLTIYLKIYYLTSTIPLLLKHVYSKTKDTVLHIHTKTLQKNTHTYCVPLKEMSQFVWAVTEGAFLQGTDLLDLSKSLSVICSTPKQ